MHDLKTEEKLYSILKVKFEVTRQYKPEWCKDQEKKSQLSFDFLINSIKLIIELDGDQHFIDIPNWKSIANNVRHRDLYKMDKAINNGFHIIRLKQDDIWNDKYDWKKELFKSIEDLPLEPTIIFICKNNEYQIYNI